MAEFRFPLFLDNDFLGFDWLFTEKNCILGLVVSTFANTVIVWESVSDRNNYCAFCLSYSVIEETNNGES